jgi:phage tail sheath protein FI
MSSNFTYPGVYIQELPSTVHTIVPAPTAVAAFVGRAIRGPINDPVRIHSYADFERSFGGVWTQSDMAYAVQQYFLNGGSDAYIVRAITQAIVSAQTSAPAAIGISTVSGTLYISAQNPGSWFQNVTITIDLNTRKVNGVREPDEFNVTMSYREVDPVTGAASITVETFPNVSYLAGDANYISTVLENDSNFIAIQTGAAVPQAQPAPGSYTLGGPVWVPNTPFTLGAVVYDSNGNEQVVTVAGSSGRSSPNWNAAVGGTTLDGTVTWTNQGGVSLSVWQPNFGYVLNQVIFDGKNLQKVTALATPTGAKSGSAAPSPWNTTVGGPTADNGITWTNIGPVQAGVWEPNTAVVAGTEIYDANDNVQIATTAGTTGATLPTWNTALGGKTSDPGGAQWKNLGPLVAAGWAASTTPPVGTLIVDSNGNIQEVTISGETGAAPPGWLTAKGSATVDNHATWTNLGPFDATGWQANTVVAAGTLIKDSNNNIEQASVTGDTGSAPPTWNAATGGVTTETSAGLTWTNLGPMPAALWDPETYYPVSAQIYDSNGNLQKVTTAGISGATAPTWLTATGAITSDGSVVQWKNLGPTGLSDGAPLVQADLTDPSLELNKYGIYALKNAEIFTLMILPPYGPQENGGTIDLDPTYSTIWSDALAFCQIQRAMLLVDPPSPASTWFSESKAYQDLTSSTPSIDGIRDPNSVLYYPWIQAIDPLINNRPRNFAPSATAAGVMARIDATRGVWKSPAGEEATLSGVAALQYLLSNDENGDLNPLAINCFRTFPIIGSVVWGARTLDGADAQSSQWKYLAVRRMALFIETSLYSGTQWAVFEPNADPLWSQLRLNVGSFMRNLFRQGAFQGTTPQQAYFVQCDSDTTTQTDIDNGVVNILVGFAPLKPAEFVVIKISQITGDTSS